MSEPKVVARPERDWAKWLPPGPLADTGPKTYRLGQVWAWRYNDHAAGVVRITDPEAREQQETLASGYPGLRDLWTDCKGPCGRHSVLVQDVGQPEPTPPHILYATPSPSPDRAVPRVMEARGDGFPSGCLACGDTTTVRSQCYHCDACLRDNTEFDARRERRREWQDGRRDFPRPPANPQRVAPPEVKTCDRCGKPATINCLCAECDAWLEARHGAPPEVVPAKRKAQELPRCKVRDVYCTNRVAHAATDLCERHIGEVMVFSDRCRLKPSLFPSIPDHPSPTQSRPFPVAVGGVINLRGGR